VRKATASQLEDDRRSVISKGSISRPNGIGSSGDYS